MPKTKKKKKNSTRKSTEGRFSSNDAVSLSCPRPTYSFSHVEVPSLSSVRRMRAKRAKEAAARLASLENERVLPSMTACDPDADVELPHISDYLPPIQSPISSSFDGEDYLEMQECLDEYLSPIEKEKVLSIENREIDRVDVYMEEYEDSEISEVLEEGSPPQIEAIRIIKENRPTPVRKQYAYSKCRIPEAETIVVRVKEATGKKSVITYKINRDNTVPMAFRMLAVRPHLIQDSFFCEPYWLLVATILLNKTSNKQAMPILYAVKERWPTIQAVSQARQEELKTMIECLGLSTARSKSIIKMAKMWLEQPPTPDKVHKSRVIVTDGPRYPHTPISHFPGLGKYALDSWRMYCNRWDPKDWRSVMPSDKELRLRQRWLFAANGSIWCSKRGVIGPVTEEYLEALCAGNLSPLCTADEWVALCR